MSTVHRDAHQPGHGIVFTKGAPDAILGRCTREMVGDERQALTAARREEILQSNDALAGQALRTLGVAGRWLTTEEFAEHQAHADKRLEQDLVLVGLIGMIDPLRPQAKDAVARAGRAGIRPLMITGDHPRTAAVIAQELCISSTGA
jgi:Ca2+-transporting ATPase